jgi:hypothetical protein
MKSRLYLETTIPSYLTSRPSRDLIVAGRQQITRDWWDERRGAFQLYISQLVIDEVGAGDPAAARDRLRVLQDLPLLDITFEVAELAASMLASGTIPGKAATYRNCGGAWNGFLGNLELRAHRECDDC